MRQYFFPIIFLLMVALGLGLFFFGDGDEPTACTMEALVCPDGSTVGRTGPQCEFLCPAGALCEGGSACPAVEIPESWQATTSANFTFRYPADLSTEYIQPMDWPPMIERVTDAFVCTPSGNEGLSAGRTVERRIGNRNYCITTVVGAAAGSSYKMLAYATNRGGETIVFTFSLREPQCANYGDRSKQLACEEERQAFTPDPIVDKIMSSLH